MSKGVAKGDKKTPMKQRGMGTHKIVNHKMMDPKDVQRLLDDAWLNLDVTDEEIYNPLEIIPRAFDEEPHIFLTWMLSNPYYLSAFCKEILNVTIFPTQALIIQELWTHKFPILLGSRGLSKTFTIALYAFLRSIIMQGRKSVIVGASFRQSKILFEYLEQIWRNAPLLRDMIGQGKRDDQIIKHDSSMWTFIVGESRIHSVPLGDGCQVLTTQVLTSNGFRTFNDIFTQDEQGDIPCNISIWGNTKFRDTNYKHTNGLSKTKKITLTDSTELECTYNHQYKIITGTGIVWRRADELKIGDYLVIDRTERWHNNDFDCTVDEAYALGAITGDGCWTGSDRIGFASKDMEIVDRVKKGGVDLKQLISDPVHFVCYGKRNRQEFLDKWNLKTEYSHTKYIPNNMLSASKEKMVAFLQGIFDSDGSVITHKNKSGEYFSVILTSTSKRLIDQIKFILLHFGILSHTGIKQTNEKWHTCYDLKISGNDSIKFIESIGFYLQRKQNKALMVIAKKKRFYSSKDFVPFFQKDIAKLRKLYEDNTVTSSSHIMKKKEISITLGRKVIDSAIKNNIFVDKDLLDIFDGNNAYIPIKSIEDSENYTYDIQIPDGHEYCANGCYSHNTTIRGLRANDTYAEEMASINEHIFENVVAGFGIVSSGPVDNIRKESTKRMREKLGLEPEKENIEDIKSNQTILSGTCYYQFNHFYRYFTKYRDIIRSRGDVNKLKELVGDEVYNPHFSWKDYCIIRIPYNLLPEGYFDAAQLSRNKLNTLPSNFLAEYGACFPADSDGFFKRSLINQCIASTYTPIIINEKPVGFLPALEGNPHSKYVYGLDPASEADNLAIVILELFEDHKRIVYSWTTNKFKHQKQLKTQNTHEHNYWAYCCRKLRSLMKTFPPLLIAIDSQGGGNAVRESLADNDKLQQGETPLYPIPDPAKPLFSDTQEGKHILKMCNFADNKWLSNAYFDTKKDFTDRVLLFPSFDDASIGIAQTGMENEEIVIEGGLEDTLDNLLQEIEELKNELTCIMHMKNPSGGDKFTVPEMKSADGKKLKVRKDRASALIMANSMARVIQRDTHTLEYESNGGFSQPSKSEGMLFANNAYFGKQLSEAYSIY